MGCSPFANSHFQMGVTVMGFAEHFGLHLGGGISRISDSTLNFVSDSFLRNAQEEIVSVSFLVKVTGLSDEALNFVKYFGTVFDSAIGSEKLISLANFESA